MRRVGMLCSIALGAVFAFVPGGRPAPAPARGPLPDRSLSFRIIFGERQERLEDYSGSLTLTEGKVTNVAPWRLFKEDTVNPDGSWKVHVKLLRFENQPKDPRPLDTSEAVFNLVPAGVTVTVDAPPTAVAQVHTVQGDFRFALS